MAERPADVLRGAYVGLWRSARRVADRSGALAALDARGAARPAGVAAQVRSMFAIHDAADLVALDVPWWTYGAAARVAAHLDALGGSARVLEYGSGASSVWLARRAAHVTSVEHEPGWAALVRDLARDAGVADRLDVREVPPRSTPEPLVPSGRRGEGGRDYAAYVRAIDDVPGELDLVVVDGRARAACLEAATRRLAPGGLVLLDDSQRPRYAAALASCGLDVHRIRGWVPSLPYPRESAVLTLPARA
ncbi:class I SAM-dependent methyltransferase [Cellulomonas triticagri]|uniref:Class I SAM-dependent methyltransferase n=1 Tax=Cellulomonas triticagri TaxID=2483352 RepID=A0A3M2JN94_9CELL|nr:class I SAM-dependent methyltransferase [Cellulomonas triticagri]RMI13290.1 class I SAM-dependent methyltransferase [Cellulomonas triticagri]